MGRLFLGLAVLLTPLVVVPLFHYPYIFPKAIYFQSLMVLGGILIIFYAEKT